MHRTRTLLASVSLAAAALTPGCSPARTDWRSDPAQDRTPPARCVEQPDGNRPAERPEKNKERQDALPPGASLAGKHTKVVEIVPLESRTGAPGVIGRTLIGDWPRRSTRRIDVSFHRTSVHNALRFFAEVTRLNVVVAEEVRGEVTMELRNVPWIEALRAVLEVEQLVAVKEGNVVRVLRRADLLTRRER